MAASSSIEKPISLASIEPTDSWLALCFNAFLERGQALQRQQRSLDKISISDVPSGNLDPASMPFCSFFSASKVKPSSVKFATLFETKSIISEGDVYNRLLRFSFYKDWQDKLPTGPFVDCLNELIRQVLLPNIKIERLYELMQYYFQQDDFFNNHLNMKAEDLLKIADKEFNFSQKVILILVLHRLVGLVVLSSDISEMGIFQLAWALQSNTSIISLNFMSFGTLGEDDSIQYLAEALTKNNTLITLSFGANKINAEKVGVLCRALAFNKSLRSFRITGNELGAAGAMQVAQLLRRNTSLTSLSLTNCQIDIVGGEALVEAMKHNSIITVLGVKGSNLSTEQIDAINQHLQRNKDNLGQKESSLFQMLFNFLLQAGYLSELSESADSSEPISIPQSSQDVYVQRIR